MTQLKFGFPGPMEETLADWVEQDATSASLSTKFKVYYRLRPFIPIWLRRRLQQSRNQGIQPEGSWYINQQFLSDWSQAVRSALSRDPDQEIIHPWPNPFNWAACLTHDVETASGVELIPQLAELEQKHGLRSVWNFVPHKYEIDAGLLGALRDQGHEIGVHGYNHDGRLFLSQSLFRKRAKPINTFAKANGIRGFRAPMVHRNLEWQQDLDIDWDASCFDVDPFQAMPGGVGAVWPFVAGRFVELPYTLPQDHTLMVALGVENAADVWFEKMELLRRLAGMAMVITHPDYLDSQERLREYERLLVFLTEQETIWKALPSEVATWWRRREESQISDGKIAGPAATQGRKIRIASLFEDFLELQRESS